MIILEVVNVIVWLESISSIIFAFSDSALNCRTIAESGHCTTTDVTFKAILAVECAGSCGLCRYGGCIDNNYLLCSMLQKLCEISDYHELMVKKMQAYV